MCPYAMPADQVEKCSCGESAVIALPGYENIYLCADCAFTMALALMRNLELLRETGAAERKAEMTV